MPKIDIQSNMGAIVDFDKVGILTLSTVAPTDTTNAIKMHLDHQGIVVGIRLSFVITPPEKITYNFELKSGSDPWRPVPPQSILPTWNQQYGNILYNAVAPYIQTVGFVGAGDYWRLSLTGDNLADTRYIAPVAIVKTDVTPFTEFTVRGFPIDEANP